MAWTCQSRAGPEAIRPNLSSTKGSGVGIGTTGIGVAVGAGTGVFVGTEVGDGGASVGAGLVGVGRGVDTGVGDGDVSATITVEVGSGSGEGPPPGPDESEQEATGNIATVKSKYRNVPALRQYMDPSAPLLHDFMAMRRFVPSHVEMPANSLQWPDRAPDAVRSWCQSQASLRTRLHRTPPMMEPGN